jgi:hypothetical protein
MLQMTGQNERNKVLAVKNRRLAVALGIIAASIYGGYILAYCFF